MRGQHLVKDDAPHAGLNSFPVFRCFPDLDLGSEVDLPQFVGQLGFLEAAQDSAFTLGSRYDRGQVVATENHVKGGGHYGLAGAGQQHIMGAEHDFAGALNRRLGQGNVNGHLVTVEVGVKGGTYQGVYLYGAAVDKHRLESLDAEAVQGGSAVEQYGLLLDHLFQYVVYLGLISLHQAAGALDVVAEPLLHQAAHDKGLEQLHRHPPGQPALVELKLGTDHDNRASAIIDPLAQQVLAEAPLFAPQHVGERLQLVITAHRNSPPPPAVID
ncbi:hypothetical protein ES708_11243 [subsurface metagenome]